MPVYIVAQCATTIIRVTLTITMRINKNIELGNSSKIPTYQNKANANKCNSNYSSYLDDHNEDNAKDDGDNNDARH